MRDIPLGIAINLHNDNLRTYKRTWSVAYRYAAILSDVYSVRMCVFKAKDCWQISRARRQ